VEIVTGVTIMDRRRFLKTAGAAAAAMSMDGCSALKRTSETPRRPNILFAIADDMSWLHAGAYGDRVVSTPAFDRVAAEGVLFTHAFCAAPSCTPSRGAILTGQEIWRLEEGGILNSTLPAKFGVYPDMLEEAGYFVGYIHKGWAPGNYKAGGWDHNPAGSRKYSKRRVVPPYNGIKKTDYAANFEDFLNDRPPNTPFCFWYGCKEPHRTYERGSGLRAGKRPEDVQVPGFLPDVSEIRSDILDYYVEVEWYDRHLGLMLDKLEQIGELDNTLVVVTSDNGMPFPRAKANLYDAGTRMPLAVRWGSRIKGGRAVDDMASLTDLAPTFLEAAGLEVPPDMTGRSLLAVLFSEKSGLVDPARDEVFTAFERHTLCRAGGVGYPCRAVRTHRWLYIRNYRPDRWPAGDPDFDSGPLGIYGDADGGPTRTYMIENRDDPRVATLFGLAFGRRPDEELYDVREDPWQINNLAGDTRYADVKRSMNRRLARYLRKTKDPRLQGESPWDGYRYY
jgi:uncharacterized sulfatase